MHQVEPGPDAATGAPVHQDDVRVGHAERQEAADALARHCALGRLTVEEFDQRSAVVWRACTHRELAVPLADLPHLERAAPPRSALAPGPLIRLLAHLQALPRTARIAAALLAFVVAIILIAAVAGSVLDLLPFGD